MTQWIASKVPQSNRDRKTVWHVAEARGRVSPSGKRIRYYVALCNEKVLGGKSGGYMITGYLLANAKVCEHCLEALASEAGRAVRARRAKDNLRRLWPD
jgi:hypothetical protein